VLEEESSAIPIPDEKGKKNESADVRIKNAGVRKKKK